MASESSEELTVSVDLPADLVEWLDDVSGTAEMDRETMVAQLLASYRAVEELDEERTGEAVLYDADELRAELEDELGEKIEDRVLASVSEELDSRVEAALSEQVDQRVESLLAERLTEATNGVQRQLGGRIDEVEADYQEKLQDVRQRVIQVKKETDTKAAADHTHPELEGISELRTEVQSLQEEFTEFREVYEEEIPEQRERTDTHAERLEEIHDRLQTVAWVVSDLREAQQSTSGLEAVERIKRAAARADIERANCENCGESVLLSLMTDPHCPHCDATVTNVEPSSGWFGKPTLTVASQLESGEEQ